MEAERENMNQCAESPRADRKSSKGERFEELTSKLEKAQRRLRRASHEFREAQDDLAFCEDLVLERQKELRLFIQSTGGSI